MYECMGCNLRRKNMPKTERFCTYEKILIPKYGFPTVRNLAKTKLESCSFWKFVNCGSHFSPQLFDCLSSHNGLYADT